ncbi:DNA-3-methyladenine glycosylase 2 family protein [Rhodococcus sp. H29-C3]|uniref:DNA-3-methyladenine glycosylase family protein n=1 Tax=Rhodococcus sp. H29-C3 TaxID=3046307 RepID=UPI0024BB5B91|nr:DNA-3-methyladenine glycosylase 2 family protein [Rhodococcus sp. H29-C3]MDJ0362856.1 DNA-3-methyladenine glycosylase 2 family protein [Rhodococcus sp. H29-C3]
MDAAMTLSPLRRGKGDPTFERDSAGSVWRTSRLKSGVLSYRLTQLSRYRVRSEAWGAGAAEFTGMLPALLGNDDDASDFAPEHPTLIQAHREFPHLRLGRTGLVMEALVPAILEQRVHGISAFASWRRLVTKFGERAPGPTPKPMFVPPTAEVWRMIPSWEFHLANVDPARSKTIVRCAQSAGRLEETATMTAPDATRRLRSIPGVGVWTAAEVAQRAFGDPDALSVGDYHLAAVVGWSLLGRPLDDAAMVEYLEPLAPHRFRAVRLLAVSGKAVKPKFGPRTSLVDHSGH